MNFTIPWEQHLEKVRKHSFFTSYGKVSEIVGLTIQVEGLDVFIGEICEVQIKKGARTALAEVVGFVKQTVLLMPLDEMKGIGPGSLVKATGHALTVSVGDQLLGHTLDGLGRPLDGMVATKELSAYPVMQDSPDPFQRKKIEHVMSTGIRALDGLLTVGEGQRIGVFAGSGVGKSTLLGMIAKFCQADVIVIGLIGERGREVREFIEKDLGEEGYKKAVVVCATSDMPPLVRLKGAHVATAIAEYYRDQGKKVVLMMDSVTRFAMAQREIGLSTGEPPTTKGYTPSVFAELPKLLERSGMSAKGSITAFYTVLVEGDDMNEPIADAVRGILDGHIVLSRKIAAHNHYPAISIADSLSRLMKSLVSEQHAHDASELRESMSVYNDAKDLIEIGAYKAGTNAVIDYAVSLHHPITDFLQQRVDEYSDFAQTREQLHQLFSENAAVNVQRT
ncbi:flagellar protein export ATPase FliI [Liquorilactobacillus satsumensis]|uniref:Flagellum specific ATP synthase n=2 Tax=Liquorilactobacillus satsumensis TaxID=259059 RepID=A0A0R1V5L0_9LACO|nr:flagellar protein export ATPase FliI [Liquorilactobacillus satsumensis]AJA34315.1 flagellum-specific ATP synthase [Liquorilactobacillus satsumensis]KRL99162.1 flagellum specific ATP synthase [Liquorilactobacillus satsumensis DSM 16230 = JCM 12392]MCC7666593.1 flagellar protein export ATPase FliI [Liquorilactobacillus satsumensis]MCP9312876.1 flagellar protein export ATPase FliI [Liquorilactobacillus satsumensis]MCP9329285.1 flagellar protein export ATPase FliI [Liquorilactobacillus satsumen